MSSMGRREFVALLGGATAWPIAVRAQHGVIPIVGYLSGASSDSLTAYPAVFRRSLAEAGYVEGQNVEIEYRWAGDQPDRLPELATELVSRKVTVLYAVSNAAAYAAKAATSTMPIVFPDRRRPDRDRPCRQPQSTGRQRYRRNPGPPNLL